MATDKKNIWKIVIQTLITILTSIGTGDVVRVKRASC